MLQRLPSQLTEPYRLRRAFFVHQLKGGALDQELVKSRSLLIANSSALLRMGNEGETEHPLVYHRE